MSKTKVVTEIKKTFICLETNKILKESFHKFETDYSFNPLTIVDNKLVPIVNDFIFGLPTEVQKPLIYLENYIGKGVNQFLKGLNFLSEKLKVLNIKTNEQLEKYLKEHKLITKDNQILSFKIIGGLLIIIFLLSAFKGSEKSFEDAKETITYTKVSDNKVLETLPIIKKESKTPQERKAKNALKKEKKLLGAVKKENKEVKKLLKSFETVPLLPTKKVLSLQSLKKMESDVIVFNPSNIKKVYNGKISEELLTPKDNKIQKFTSYDDAVIYLFHAANYHNSVSENKINVYGFMAQMSIEAGIRVKDGGYISKLGTYANNLAGIKTGDNVPIIKSKDDDRNKFGKLVHSNFKIFGDIQEFISHYAYTVNKPRYVGLEQVKYEGKIITANMKPFLNNGDYFDYLHSLRKSGYCTQDPYVYERMCRKVFENEMKPVLKYHGLI